MQKILRKDYILPIFWLFFFVVYSKKDNRDYQRMKTNYAAIKKHNSLVSNLYLPEGVEVKNNIIRTVYGRKPGGIK